MPELFSPCYQRLVRAGELGKALDETLRSAASLLTKEWHLVNGRRDDTEPLFLINPHNPIQDTAWETLSPDQRTIALILFFESFAILLQSGVPILQTMQCLAEMLPEPLSGAIISSREDVKLGEPFAQSLARISVLPPFTIEMLQQGEEAGTLDTVLHRCATVFEQELEDRPSSTQRI
jgi:type II secretory pathway component PulF